MEVGGMPEIHFRYETYLIRAMFLTLELRPKSPSLLWKDNLLLWKTFKG